MVHGIVLALCLGLSRTRKLQITLQIVSSDTVQFVSIFGAHLLATNPAVTTATPCTPVSWGLVVGTTAGFLTNKEFI